MSNISQKITQKYLYQQEITTQRKIKFEEQTKCKKKKLLTKFKENKFDLQATIEEVEFKDIIEKNGTGNTNAGMKMDSRVGIKRSRNGSRL